MFHTRRKSNISWRSSSTIHRPSNERMNERFWGKKLEKIYLFVREGNRWICSFDELSKGEDRGVFYSVDEPTLFGWMVKRCSLIDWPSVKQKNKTERFEKKREEGWLIIWDNNADLFHRSSIVREMKVNESDLPSEYVMKKNETVNTDEWTDLQASFTTVG